jgi:hypothetical protein
MKRTLIVVVLVVTLGAFAAVQGLAAGNKPGKPTLTVADRPGDQGFYIQLTIGASADDGGGEDDVTRYRVERANGNVAGPYQFVKNVVASKQPQYILLNRAPSKTRPQIYKVMAYDGTLLSDAVYASAYATDNTAPRPPRNFTVTDVPNDQGKALRLNWTRSMDDGAGAADVLNYRLSRRVPGGAFSRIAQIRATGAETYVRTNKGRTPGQLYIYQLQAYDGRLLSTAVTAEGTPLDNKAPRPPSSVTVADRPNDNGDALILTIGRSPDDGARAKDVKQYRIFRSPGPESAAAMTEIAQVSATGAASYQYTDTGLTRGRLYRYLVKAFDGTNLSRGIVGEGTPVDDVAPRPPTGLRVTDVPSDNGGAVDVSFGRSPDDGAGVGDVEAYEVYRQEGTGTLAYLREIPANGSAQYAFRDTGLRDNVLHTYRVRATDGSLYSTPILASGTPRDNTKPRPPSAFTAVPAPEAVGIINLDFDASPDDTAAHPEVTSYEIRRTEAVPYPTAPTYTIAASQRAHYQKQDPGLTVGRRYYYIVQAVGPTGASTTAYATAVATDTRRPLPPRNCVAADRPDDDGKAVIVRWDRSLDDGTGRNIVASYAVYRKLTSVFDPPVTRAKVVTANGSASYSVTDSSADLMNLRSYTYWVVAVSRTGVESSPSNESEAVPRDDIILAAPTNLAAADRPGGSNAIDLSWTRSTSEGGIGPPPPPPFGTSYADSGTDTTGDYEVFRRRTTEQYGTTPYKIVPASTTGSPLRTVDTNAQNGVTFEYKVRYRVGTAISPFSNTATATARADSSSGTDGLAVTITSAPDSAALGQSIEVVVAVTGEGLSNVRLEWAADGGAWSKTATRSGANSYEARFTLTPGSVAAGSVVEVVAIAAGAKGEARSGTVSITITE